MRQIAAPLNDNIAAGKFVIGPLSRPMLRHRSFSVKHIRKRRSAFVRQNIKRRIRQPVCNQRFENIFRPDNSRIDMVSVIFIRFFYVLQNERFCDFLRYAEIQRQNIFALHAVAIISAFRIEKLLVYRFPDIRRSFAIDCGVLVFFQQFCKTTCKITCSIQT